MSRITTRRIELKSELVQEKSKREDRVSPSEQGFTGDK